MYYYDKKNVYYANPRIRTNSMVREVERYQTERERVSQALFEVGTPRIIFKD
jgi:hypothetical protein